MKKYNFIAVILLLSLILAGWLSSGKPLQKYLSLHNPRNRADILIVEGWLDNNELDYVAQFYNNNNYQYLITTGDPLNKDLLMFKNGTFCLRVNKPASETRQLNLKVHLRGTLPYKYASVFKIYINNELIDCDSVGKKPKTFCYDLVQEDTVETVSIKFTNDAIVKGKDRNLLISSVSLNGHSYSAHDPNATYSIQTMDDSTVYNLAETQALLARNLLLKKGISEENILAISGQKPGISKTLTTAKNTITAIDSIINTSNYSINIVSVPPHTRRTYTAFCQYHPKDSIGIIAVPVSYIKDYQVNRLKNIHELLGILFIKFHSGS